MYLQFHRSPNQRHPHLRKDVLFGAILVISLCWVINSSAGTLDRPNILWLTCEDTSPHFGCYGDRTVPTPHVDRLASAGIRYTHAFGVYGVCAPNRHTLILGMYPTSTGGGAMRTWTRTSALHLIKDPELLAIPTYEATPPSEARCFTEYLRAAGYYCSNNSKTDYQFRDPITAWDDSSKKAHWRNRPDRNMPFFAVFNNTAPHESGTFKPRSPRVVDPRKITLPPYYPDTPTVRDHRYKYVRNYRPDLPYIGFIPYRDQAAMMRELIELTERGELGPEQWQFWAKKKPLEELYDTETDPHEIHNLAADPRHHGKLAELRDAHEHWRGQYGDLGLIPEAELIKRLWPPNGEQPTTADPVIEWDSSLARITCSTPGASIAYRLNRQGRWLLYVKPFTSQPGRLQAQAIRLGWKKSKIVSSTSR